jgi:succinylglutamate desuccinylase/aspartoacylase family protein
MYMQRGMYQRFDGYEKIKPLLEGTDGDVLEALGGVPALIRIPAASTAARPRARLVSCLLHGNEPSGFEAVLELLRRGERFPFDLWVLIGNVRAATEDGLYAHRHLDDQEDFNRVWGVESLSNEQRRAAAAILAELRDADLEAAIDLHNNSGRNPYYAILTQPGPAGERLAALCADTVVLWRLEAHTLMEALAPMCPAVSVECGAPHLADGAEFASGVVHRFLTADGFDGSGTVNGTSTSTSTSTGNGAGAAAPVRMVGTDHRVTVRPGVVFSFGGIVGGDTDLVIVPGLDCYNFGVMPAGRAIGHVRAGASMPLVARDMTGRDVTDSLFEIRSDGGLVVTREVMPLMMTTTVQQARRDCLFYTALSSG